MIAVIKVPLYIYIMYHSQRGMNTHTTCEDQMGSLSKYSIDGVLLVNYLPGSNEKTEAETISTITKGPLIYQKYKCI